MSNPPGEEKSAHGLPDVHGDGDGDLRMEPEVPGGSLQLVDGEARAAEGGLLLDETGGRSGRGEALAPAGSAVAFNFTATAIQKVEVGLEKGDKPLTFELLGLDTPEVRALVLAAQYDPERIKAAARAFMEKKETLAAKGAAFAHLKALVMSQPRFFAWTKDMKTIAEASPENAARMMAAKVRAELQRALEQKAHEAYHVINDVADVKVIDFGEWNGLCNFAKTYGLPAASAEETALAACRKVVDSDIWTPPANPEEAAKQAEARRREVEARLTEVEAERKVVELLGQRELEARKAEEEQLRAQQFEELKALQKAGLEDLSRQLKYRQPSGAEEKAELAMNRDFLTREGKLLHQTKKHYHDEELVKFWRRAPVPTTPAALSDALRTAMARFRVDMSPSYTDYKDDETQLNDVYANRIRMLAETLAVHPGAGANESNLVASARQTLVTAEEHQARVLREREEKQRENAAKQQELAARAATVQSAAAPNKPAGTRRHLRNIGIAAGALVLLYMLIKPGPLRRRWELEQPTPAASAPAAEPSPARAPEASAPAAPVEDPEPLTEVEVRVAIDIRDTKANGKGWDVGGGLPDIGLCVTGGRTSRVCRPGGGDSVPSGENGICQDSLTCSTTVRLDKRSSSISVELVDIDVMSNDSIGSGSCQFDAPCDVGQATVMLQQASP
jgi:hypothetical protein